MVLFGSWLVALSDPEKCINLNSLTNWYQINISNVVAKAHMRAGQILRCFLSGDTVTLLRMFALYWNIVPRFGLPLQWV